jgi:prephenate dehydrogenase
MRLRTVTIYGTGLIGGSLALALKRSFPEVRVSGVDKPEVVERALRLKIVDTAGVQPADLVILATPVGDILKLLDHFTTDQTLVADVGSTKVMICHKAERLGVPFVGGHPMAGLEHSGPEAANGNLFRNAPYFLCRVKSTPDGAMDQMQELARAIGATPHVISPEDHDKLVAQVSHLPQILSTLLAGHTAANKELAGPGLRSMTRLAASPLHIWRDIFRTSRALPGELQTFIDSLQRISDSLEAGDLDEIDRLFERGGGQ